MKRSTRPWWKNSLFVISHYSITSLISLQTGPQFQRMFVTFITAYLDLDPIFPDPPACWTPPEFEKVEEYCFELCIQCREIAPFGTYDNQSLQISLDGRVTCYGDGDYDLVGERILKCCLGFRVNKVIEIVVLGSINDTGTALLLDKEGNVWLYHTPNAADPYFTGMKSQAALVMRKDFRKQNSNFMKSTTRRLWSAMES